MGLAEDVGQKPCMEGIYTLQPMGLVSKESV